METKYIIGFVLGIAVILTGIVLINGRSQTGPSVDLTAFTQCLKDKGAQFYGAFWCPHCQATKRMFGDARTNLPYTECSTPDGKNQLPICKEKGIEVYPTWIFADGSRLEGELTLQQLAEKTTCTLPPEIAAAPTSINVTGTSSAAQ